MLGLVLGLVGAYFVGRAMKSTLYGVGSLDFGSLLPRWRCPAGVRRFLPAAFRRVAPRPLNPCVH